MPACACWPLPPSWLFMSALVQAGFAAAAQPPRHLTKPDMQVLEELPGMQARMQCCIACLPGDFLQTECTACCGMPLPSSAALHHAHTAMLSNAAATSLCCSAAGF